MARFDPSWMAPEHAKMVRGVRKKMEPCSGIRTVVIGESSAARSQRLADKRLRLLEAGVDIFSDLVLAQTSR